MKTVKHFREIFIVVNEHGDVLKEFPVYVRRDNPSPAMRMWEKAKQIVCDDTALLRRCLHPYEYYDTLDCPEHCIDWRLYAKLHSTIKVHISHNPFD